MSSGHARKNKENEMWREAHLGFDTAEQPQLLFLLLKLSSFPVFLQHFLLLLQTFSKGQEEYSIIHMTLKKDEHKGSLLKRQLKVHVV